MMNYILNKDKVFGKKWFVYNFKVLSDVIRR